MKISYENNFFLMAYFPLLSTEYWLETSSHMLDKTPLHILSSLILLLSIFKATLDKVLHCIKS